ncbi:multidrug effflux MFS transporter [Microbacterium sp. YY-01]|uniref:multidrug effflux MFS transporter n=1 Tax=Microbacterium sp. YY-01 TaxID=3421634 RepID=UPI003D183FF3
MTSLGQRRGLLLALGALSAFGPISMDLYLPSLPELQADLATSDALAQFTMSACMIGLAFGQLVWGPVSDRFGRRWPLIIAVSAFTVTAVLCAAAPTIETLIVIRLIQGLCGSAGLVIARAVVHDLYSGPAATRGYSTLAAIAGAAPILAPLGGGFLALFTDWRGVFLGLAAVGAAQLIIAIIFVPETHRREHRVTGSIGNDFRGLAEALRNGPFMLAAITMMFAFTALLTYVQMASFVFQSEYAVSPQMFAVIFAINPCGIVACAQINRRLAGSIRPQRVMMVALTVATVATAAMVAAAMAGLALVWILIPLFIAIALHGFNGPILTALSLAHITHGAGSASAIIGMLPFLAGAVVPPLVSGSGVSALVMGATMLVALVLALALASASTLRERADA